MLAFVSFDFFMNTGIPILHVRGMCFENPSIVFALHHPRFPKQSLDLLIWIFHLDNLQNIQHAGKLIS